MSWQKVCMASEVREGTPTMVSLGRREIGILRYGDSFHAVLNFCPHAGAPIARGRVEAIVLGNEPGALPDCDHDRPVLKCPWHHWEFDLTSGASVCPIKPRIKMFPLKVENGDIWIDA